MRTAWSRLRVRRRRTSGFVAERFFSAFELDLEAHRAIVARARRHGLAVMSTPFAEDVVPLLDELGVDAYKIASGDVTYYA